MTLTFTYREPSRLPLEVEGITPDAVRHLTLADIEKLPVFHGNRQSSLAEFFSVSGDPSDGVMGWEGDLGGVHWLGAGMRSGEVRIAGNAGRHVGSEMSGGTIRIDGDAGDWVGAQMRGGLIHVAGRAGHLVGAAYRGSARGMTGGTILVRQQAGHEVGLLMRRGLIAIGGNSGDLVGCNMLAGTILIFGSGGVRPGAGMRRGTIGFLGDPPPLLPSFQRGCRMRPEFLTLVLRHLHDRGMPWDGDEPRVELDLFHGDLLAGGRGEVWLNRGDRRRPNF
jgi:formylmethanofuran dehydrogenase subunit C